MKLLVVGGAGFVGKIIAPALHAAHDVAYYDRMPVPAQEHSTIVADVNDQAHVAEAVRGVDALVYLAMGLMGREDVDEVKSTFDVNLQGLYRFASAAAAAGVRRFIYTSTLSIYKQYRNPRPFPENLPPDSWHTYGVTKRLGETFCHMLAQEYPDAAVLVLRLNYPATDKMVHYFKTQPQPPAGRHFNIPLGPNDMRRAFLAALECSRPGCHVVQIAGDPTNHYYTSQGAQALLHWEPRGD